MKFWSRRKLKLTFSSQWKFREKKIRRAQKFFVRSKNLDEFFVATKNWARKMKRVRVSKERNCVRAGLTSPYLEVECKLAKTLLYGSPWSQGHLRPLYPLWSQSIRRLYQLSAAAVMAAVRCFGHADRVAGSEPVVSMTSGWGEKTSL